jgi:hypothetical protein
MSTRRGVTEQAAIAAIDSGTRALRLPTIRDRFEEIAAAAERGQLSYLGFLAELVMAECDDRGKRRAARRIHDAGFPGTSAWRSSTSTRVPEHARHQVRVECQVAPRHLTIVERRAPWREDLGPDWTSLPVARLRYSAAAKTWTLYWRDRHLRFHLYDLLAPSNKVGDLLTEIDRDPQAAASRRLPAPTQVGPTPPSRRASLG